MSMYYLKLTNFSFRNNLVLGDKVQAQKLVHIEKVNVHKGGFICSPKKHMFM